MTAPARRKRSPLGDDLRILVSGIWGFLLQCGKIFFGSGAPDA